MDPLKIPVEVPEGQQSLLLLERIAQGIEAIGASTKKAGDDAEKAKSAWDRANESFEKWVDTQAEGVETVAGVIGGINDLIGGLTALADEQARLDESSARLGLDFDQAAAAAGRFADETEAAAAANTFAQAGLRLTQQELDALTRVAGSASRTLGVSTREATEQLTQALISGAARGLRGFGGELAAVAQGGSTAAERLAALVTQAQHTEAATDSAADAQERFKDAIEDSERTFATAFVSGLARLSQVGEKADTASERLGNMRTEITAAGDTAAEVVARVGNGIGVVLGFVGTGVGTVLAGITSIASGLSALTSGNIRGASAAASAEFERSMRDGLAGDSFRFMRERIDRLNAISENDGSNGVTTRVAVDAPADMVFSADEQRAAAEDARARRRRAGGGAGAGGERPQQITVGSAAVNAAIDRALEISAEHLRSNSSERLERELSGFADRTIARAVARGMRDAMDRAISGQGDLAEEIRGVTGVSRQEAARPFGTPDDLSVSSILRDRDVARERRALEQRADAQQSYTDFMRDMHDQRIVAAREEAEAVTMGFNAMGQAMAKHVFAFATGKESVGVALQGMLADTLTSIGQEAIVKGAMQFAEGAAMLAGIYTAPLAPGHFAAGAAFMGVGALAAAAGAALTPSGSAPSGGAAPSSAPRSDRMLGTKASNDNAGPAVVNHFYAPIVGGREATDAQVGARVQRYTDATARRQQRDRRAA